MKSCIYWKKVRVRVIFGHRVSRVFVKKTAKNPKKGSFFELNSPKSSRYKIRRKKIFFFWIPHKICSSQTKIWVGMFFECWVNSIFSTFLDIFWRENITSQKSAEATRNNDPNNFPRAPRETTYRVELQIVTGNSMFLHFNYSNFRISFNFKQL